LNLRPSGYEPDELPGCSTPRYRKAEARPRKPGGDRGLVCEGGRVGGAFGLVLSAICGDLRSARCLEPVWRRPTLPRLEPQYHGRGGFSRPSSGWDRVWTPRYGHQAGTRQKASNRKSEARRVFWFLAFWLLVSEAMVFSGVSRWRGLWHFCLLVCLLADVCRYGRAWMAVACLHKRQRFEEANRTISTGRLHALPHFHPRPINVVVYHGSQGDLVWR
jgi:hypothetical protein